MKISKLSTIFDMCILARRMLEKSFSSMNKSKLNTNGYQNRNKFPLNHESEQIFPIRKRGGEGAKNIYDFSPQGREISQLSRPGREISNLSRPRARNILLFSPSPWGGKYPNCLAPGREISSFSRPRARNILLFSPPQWGGVK